MRQMRIEKVTTDYKNGVLYATIRDLPDDYIVLVAPATSLVRIADEHTIRVR